MMQLIGNKFQSSQALAAGRLLWSPEHGWCGNYRSMEPSRDSLQLGRIGLPLLRSPRGSAQT